MMLSTEIDLAPVTLQPDDLQDFDGEARVQDIRLSELLGYAEPRHVRQVIRRNKAELERFGVLLQIEAKPQGPDGGRPERIFMLTEPQAILVTMFSRTERAADARHQIVQVFMAWRHGGLPLIEIDLAALPAPDDIQPTFEGTPAWRLLQEAERVAGENGPARGCASSAHHEQGRAHQIALPWRGR